MFLRQSWKTLLHSYHLDSIQQLPLELLHGDCVRVNLNGTKIREIAEREKALNLAQARNSGEGQKLVVPMWGER